MLSASDNPVAITLSWQRTLPPKYLGQSPQGRLCRGMGLEAPSAKQNGAFCFFFLKKEEYYKTNCSLGGMPPKPQGRLRRGMCLEGPSAKQNNAFCFFFWKKKNTIRQIVYLMAYSQTLKVGFAEVWARKASLRWPDDHRSSRCRRQLFRTL
jgi:hypothetical protein